MTINDRELTDEEFVDLVINEIISETFIKAITEHRQFRLYFWSFRHIIQWEIRNERKYIEYNSLYPPRISKITIPGIKLTKRPRKPK